MQHSIVTCSPSLSVASIDDDDVVDVVVVGGDKNRNSSFSLPFSAVVDGVSGENTEDSSVAAVFAGDNSVENLFMYDFLFVSS